MEYVYIFDFTDCIKITCQRMGGKYHKDMDLAAFARFCEEELPDSYKEPELVTAMDWNDDNFEYVSMLDESGAPYFHFKVNGSGLTICAESSWHLSVQRTRWSLQDWRCCEWQRLPGYAILKLTQ